MGQAITQERSSLDVYTTRVATTTSDDAWEYGTLSGVNPGTKLVKSSQSSS